VQARPALVADEERQPGAVLLDEGLERPTGGQIVGTSIPPHAVELRFFGGLEVEEAAAILGVSKETAKLDWRVARARLNRELAGEDAR